MLDVETMKLLAGYSPIVVGAVLLVVVLAFGLIYTRRSEGFANKKFMEGFNQEQVNAACKTLDEQLAVYKAELAKPVKDEETKKLHEQLRESQVQMENVKKQYGCP